MMQNTARVHIYWTNWIPGVVGAANKEVEVEVASDERMSKLLSE